MYRKLAARLWDIAPTGNQTLVARGLYAPTRSDHVVRQLHANAWHFAAGHVVKLQPLVSRLEAPRATFALHMTDEEREIMDRHATY